MWSSTLYNIRPILDSILQKCLSLYKLHQENSTDEAMVGFKGRSSLKQYVPSKPTKCGYKVWVRCGSRNGFTCCFQVYTGKVGGTTVKNVGARVVMDVSNDILDKGYHLYSDNYFLVQAYCQTYLQEILTVLVLCEYTGSISQNLVKELSIIWKGDNHYPGKF